MWRSAGAVAGVICLAGLMPSIFYAYIDPKEEYRLGIAVLSLDERVLGCVASATLLLVALGSLRWIKDRASFWAAASIYATLIVPGVVVGPLVFRESPWDIFEVNVFVVICFIGFVLLAGVVEDSFLWFWSAIVTNSEESELVGHVRHCLDWIVLVLLMAGTFAVVATRGFSIDLRYGLDDVYVVRVLARDAGLGFLGYVAIWVIVLSPSVVCGLLVSGRKNLALALIITLGIETAMLAATSVKVGLWHAVLPILYFALQPLEHRARILSIVAGLCVVTLVLPMIGALIPESAIVFQGVPRRVFYASGWLHGFAIDLFSVLPPFDFEDLRSYFTGEIVGTRYTFILGSLVGLGYDTNANVNFLIDGYVNGRYLGMAGVALAAAVTVGLVGGATVASRSQIGTVFLITLGQAYTESAAQQVYLTSGVWLMLIFLVVRGVLTRHTRAQPEVQARGYLTR